MTIARAATLAACLGLVAGVGCSRDIHTRIPTQPEEATGTITIILTQAAKDLTISINGTLVTERAHTKRVQVDGVPAGIVDIVIAAGAGPERIERHMQVDMHVGANVFIPVAAPSKSMSSAMSMGFLSLGAWILSRALVLAFL